MKSELSFLTDLFLNDDVPTPIKKLIASRIKEVEKMLTQPDVPRGTIQPLHVPNGVGVVDMQGGTLGAIAQQAPSMQRIMAQNPDLIPAPPKPKTPAAAAALAARQNLINGAGNEKPEEGRRAPRKI